MGGLFRCLFQTPICVSSPLFASTRVAVSRSASMGGGCSIVRNNQSYCLSFCQPPAWEGCSVDYTTCGFVFGYCELQSTQISALLTVYKPIVGYSSVRIFTQILLNEELNSSFIYVHHVRVRILMQSTILFCLFTTSINRRGFFQIRTTRFPSEMEA